MVIKKKNCSLCECSKELHIGRYHCKGVDGEGFECNCDGFEDSSLTDKYCDSCLTIAFDQGVDPDFVLSDLGNEIEDHICDTFEEPDLNIKCACKCKLNKRIK